MHSEGSLVSMSSLSNQGNFSLDFHEPRTPAELMGVLPSKNSVEIQGLVPDTGAQHSLQWSPQGRPQDLVKETEIISVKIP